MQAVLAVVATTVVGLVVGVELAVAIVLTPILRRLPTGAEIAGRAVGARMLGRGMPPFYIASLVLVGALAVLAWGTPAAAVALVSAALLAGSVAMSVVLLVPINDRAKSWTVEDRPEDWRHQLKVWDLLHGVRVVIIIVALVLLSAAVAML